MSSPPPSKPPPAPPISLQQSVHKRGFTKPQKMLRHVRNVFRSLPIITPPAWKLPGLLGAATGSRRIEDGTVKGGKRVTGTIFGFRKAHASLAIQEKPKCLPLMLIELPVPTEKLLQELGAGFMRIALECQKQEQKKRIVDEEVWTMYCNGAKLGHSVKREPNEEDLNVMKLLHTVSMGAGAIPSEAEDELTYMRAYFQRVVGSNDSETYYMMNPDGNDGPELSIFFVRI
ncbi:Protein MIZU-KUSSEI 1-like, plant [Dillenia turbinata]|uniref:Protein MIZU-KUSSEI 1-like, plant n=1 Tax=Dillenia turbinata TaxID=194707 RepID=A0AAN8VFE9_9MAGN